jgi:hypothetical protein
MMRSIVQLIPSLPPHVCGVGDYAFRLGDALRTLGIDTVFLAAKGGHRPDECHILAFAAQSLPARSHKALKEALSSSAAETLLLHYSSYGYARRGAPIWLALGLRRWKAGGSHRRLVVMFHEVWAFGPPWTSSFWMSPLQRALVASIVRLADTFITNTGWYAARLQRLAPNRAPFAVLPVFSNIGEPTALPPLEAREPVAVVFGRRAARERVYARFENFLPALRSAGIEGILDIGPPVDDRAIAQCSLPVTRCGYLDPPLASATMLRAHFGLLDYPLHCAGKSGIFAAYTAHGLVPLIRSAVVGASDGLRHGVNFVCTSEPLPGLRDAAQPLATAAHIWYREHALERARVYFAQALRSPLRTALP